MSTERLVSKMEIGRFKPLREVIEQERKGNSVFVSYLCERFVGFPLLWVVLNAC
jgi:hypothetical protein